MVTPLVSLVVKGMTTLWRNQHCEGVPERPPECSTFIQQQIFVKIFLTICCEPRGQRPEKIISC